MNRRFIIAIKTASLTSGLFQQFMILSSELLIRSFNTGFKASDEASHYKSGIKRMFIKLRRPVNVGKCLAFFMDS